MSMAKKQNNNYSKTRFKCLIRIDPKQKDWIKDNKGEFKTMAGKLDQIINFFKKKVKHGNKR